MGDYREATPDAWRHLDRNGRDLRAGDRVRHVESRQIGTVMYVPPTGPWVLVAWDDGPGKRLSAYMLPEQLEEASSNG